MMFTNKTRETVYSACHLAGLISGDGILPKDYKKTSGYIDAGFIGDVFAYSGGIDYIDAGLIGVAEVGIIIAFRGTDGTKDWLNDFKAWQTNSPYSKGQVHTGFLRSVQNIEQQILSKLRKMMNESPPRQVYCVGHSKGGAVATLMGLSVCVNIERAIEKLMVVSFGSPRVGNAEFCADYMIDHRRYESFLDIVPHLPFSAQEHDLFTRSSTLFEKYDLINVFLQFPPYMHTGTRVAFKQEQDIPAKYLKLPMEKKNAKLETLNSFATSLRPMIDVRSKDDLSLITKIHCHDYDKIPADIDKCE
jgi:hypothetical protein